MRRKTTSLLVSLLLVSAPLLANSVAVPNTSADHEAAPVRDADLIAAMRQDGTANALLTAALTRQSLFRAPLKPQVMQWLDRAAELAPHDPAIAAVALNACRLAVDCDLAAHADRLQSIAPHDALYLLPSLQAARQADDPTRVMQILRDIAAHDTLYNYHYGIAADIKDAMAKSSHWQPPWQQQGHEAGQPLPRGVPRQLGRKVMLATQASVKASIAKPAHYEGLVEACTEDSPNADERRRACRRIGEMLQETETIPANLIGLTLLRRTATTEQERQAAVQRQRQIRWQMNHYNAQRPAPSDLDAEGWSAYFHAVLALLTAKRKAGSEIAGIAAELERMGEPLTPPTGWRSHAWRARHGEAATQSAAGAQDD